MAYVCVVTPPKSSKNKADCDLLSRRKLEHIESLGKEIHTLGAEYSAAATLVATYFGPETRKAIEALNQSGWSTETAKLKPVLDAIAFEMDDFPK